MPKVSITDPTYHPYGVITRLMGARPEHGYELHVLEPSITGSRENWRELARELETSGLYEWVRLVTLGVHDDETGEVFKPPS